MRMKGSVFAVIAIHPNGRTERVADFDIREEAEDRAAAEKEYAAGAETFEVRLLDRRQPVTSPSDEEAMERAGYDFLTKARIRKAKETALRPMPAGIECFLVGATPAERERCLAIYGGCG